MKAKKPGFHLYIKALNPADLNLNPQNPRKHSAEQVRKIARSIKTFGFNIPLVVDQENRILCGHGRYAAAKELGLTEVPVIQIEHLSPAQAKAFSIADNRLTEIAQWDEHLLGEIFMELGALELDFDLEITGFSTPEIDLKIEGLTPAAKQDPADEIPARSGPPVSVIGDLWILGRHRVFCGNSIEDDSFRQVMGTNLAQMVFVDAPYNVSIKNHAGGNGAIQHREFAMASGEMTELEFTNFLTNSFKLVCKYTTDGSIHYQCADWRHLSEFLTAGKQSYDKFINLAVWVKDTGGMGSFYRSQHELVLVFANGKGKRQNNVQLGKFGRNRTNVWAYPGIMTMSRQSEEGNLLALHPTVKPIAMVADAILDCTSRNDAVIDPFLGSGTTLMAAERVGRICHGIEIDPIYVDTAIRRWQKHTGDRAIHASSGKTFDEIASIAGGRHE